MVQLPVPDYSTDSDRPDEGARGETQGLLDWRDEERGSHHTMGQEKGGCMERKQAGGAWREEQTDKWRKEGCRVGLREEKKGHEKEEGWGG